MGAGNRIIAYAAPLALFAIVAVSFQFLARRGVLPSLPLSLLIHAAVVVFAAWFGGRGPALLLTVAGAVAATLPRFPGLLDDAPLETGLALGAYVVVATTCATRLARRGETTLSERNHPFRTLSESIPQLVWMAHADGAIFWYNQRWYDYTGTTPAQMKGWGWTSVHDPAVLPRVMERWRSSIATGDPFEMVFPLRGKDGEFRPFLTRIVPVRDAEGRVVRWFGTNTDLGRQRQFEERIRLAEEASREILESIADGFYAVDREWRFVYVNPQAGRLLEREPDELLGRVLWDEVPDLVGSEFERAHRRAADERVATPVTAPLPGGTRWIEAHVSPSVRGLSVYLRDVTERKRVEEALLESQRLYRAIGESIDYGVWVCDVEGRNVYASDSFLRLVGLTQEQCSEFGWGEVLHPEELERTLAAWKECVRSGQQWDMEHRFRGRDGRWHPILARGVPVRNDRGEVTAWAGINLDISRLKQVEEDLREADRRKDQFLATLAHELRNPLAPVRNALEIMKRARGDAETIEQARVTMERQVAHMVRLIDDLLDVSRIAQNRLELKVERLELADVVEHAVEASEPFYRQSGHRLHVELPPEPVFLEADPVRLAQVLGNLLHNAAKYTPAGGRIELVAERRGGEVELRVKDDGLGIPQEMLGKIFELFTQVDDRSGRADGGLGIGLSLVRWLVEKHGGSVTASSDGPGRGSEFVVRLPALTDGSRPERGPSERAPDRAPAPARRVLVVDDNRDGADTLATLLESSGDSAFAVYDGKKAVEAAEELRPDVALLDLGLPGLSGHEVAREIRRRPWGKDVLLVALTGWGQEEDRERSRAAGFDAHLVKPVDPSELLAVLHALEEGSRRSAS